MVVGDDVAGRQHDPAAQTHRFTRLVVGLDHHHRVFHLLVNLARGERQRRLRQRGKQGKEQERQLYKRPPTVTALLSSLVAVASRFAENNTFGSICTKK